MDHPEDEKTFKVMQWYRAEVQLQIRYAFKVEGTRYTCVLQYSIGSYFNILGGW